VLGVLAVALVAGGVRAPAAPTPTKESVAVGTGGADATRAGIQILREGGNAVDAAVAANAVLGVTEPFVAGIGGGGFMVVYLAQQNKVFTIDGRETAPQTFPENAFIDPATKLPIPFTPQRVTSAMAVGVPGPLATWTAAASGVGTMPLERLLQPAIAVAERGFVVDPTFRGQISDNLTRLRAFTSSRALFLTPDGQPPEVGSTFRNPDLARAYRLIGHNGPAALYHGAIGAALIATVDHPPVAPDSTLGFAVQPGLMTLGDLARYTAPFREPTHVSYRGYDVYGMAPPSSGGSTVGEALNILEGFTATPDRALALHRYLEASKLAFADRNRWVGDPDFVSVPLAGLLSKGFAGERRCLIGPTALAIPVQPGDPFPPYSTCGHDGRPLLGLGSPGGSTIITTVLPILLDRLDFGMSLLDAIAAPRASQRNSPTTVEPAFAAQYGTELTQRFGQLFGAPTAEIGSATGIEVLPNGELQAAAEPTRRGGGAAAVVCPAAGHPLPASPNARCAPVPGG
jgi:gamma-glutamyltranspeptidase/glutathione hydrolase